VGSALQDGQLEGRVLASLADGFVLGGCKISLRGRGFPMNGLAVTRSFVGRGAIALLLVLFAVQVPAFAGQAEDWAELKKFHDGFTKFMNQYNATGEKDVAVQWRTWAPEFSTFQKKFKASYGSSADEMKKALEGSLKPEDLGGASWGLLELLATDVETHQKDIAKWLKEAGDKGFVKWESFKPEDVRKFELKMDYAKRALSKYSDANDLDPEGGYAEAVAKAQKAVDTSTTDWKGTLKDIEWPGNNEAFAGPGDPDDLVGEAIAFLNRQEKAGEKWSKPEYDDVHIPVAACVVGSGWEVHKKEPITEKPTQYSLKFYVAFKGEKDPSIGYGYYMYFYTKEESGVKPEAPFKFANSAQYACSQILLDTVPAKARKAGGGSSSSSGGFMGLVFRLLLSAALLAAGAILSEGLLRAQLPQVAVICSSLAAKAPQVGRAALVIGGLTLVRTTVLHFAPLSDILPQLIAMAAGVLVIAGAKGLKTGEAGPSDCEEEGKGACGFCGKMDAIAAKLQPYQAVIGRAALVLGIAHLLLGGFGLV
jgi:hypothetical protein